MIIKNEVIVRCKPVEVAEVLEYSKSFWRIVDVVTIRVFEPERDIRISIFIHLDEGEVLFYGDASYYPKIYKFDKKKEGEFESVLQSILRRLEKIISKRK